MWPLIRKILSKDASNVRILAIDEQDPSLSSSFILSKTQFIAAVVILAGASVVITSLLFFLTPLWSLFQDRENQAVIEQVRMVSDRVGQLQDSLDRRDRQLQDLRMLIRMGADTTFQASVSLAGSFYEPSSPGSDPVLLSTRRDASFAFAAPQEDIALLSRQRYLRTGRAEQTSTFPLLRPATGLISQPFNPEEGHFGIDLAMKDGDVFRSAASGTVIQAVWTMEFGYVMGVLHENGSVSYYKHASRLSKEVGDRVSRGDVLGTVGDRGLFSSGPHLHFELWTDGVARDPQGFFTR
jgi:murein DD-endopeptidase MepM/ murein hydrolase activator NlpD